MKNDDIDDEYLLVRPEHPARACLLLTGSIYTSHFLGTCAAMVTTVKNSVGDNFGSVADTFGTVITVQKFQRHNIWQGYRFLHG